MRNEGKSEPGASHSARETVLYVTDCVHDSQSSVDLACQMAEERDALVEIIHVIDPEHTPSRPDAQMGVQYRLEGLARGLTRLKGSARALVLFGKPEYVISKRARDIRAILIAFPFNGPAPDRVLHRLVRSLTQMCNCPVLMLPTNLP